LVDNFDHFFGGAVDEFRPELDWVRQPWIARRKDATTYSVPGLQNLCVEPSPVEYAKCRQTGDTRPDDYDVTVCNDARRWMFGHAPRKLRSRLRDWHIAFRLIVARRRDYP
jgi:hypothetical protein